MKILTLVKRTISEFANDNVTLVAAGIAFYLLLSLVPALTALTSLYAYIADPADVAGHIQVLLGQLPDGAMNIISAQLERVTSADQSKAGLAAIFALLLSLWSGNAAMKALVKGMNMAYNVEEDRGFIKLNAITLVFTISAIIGLIGFILALGGLLASPPKPFDILAPVIAFAVLAFLFLTFMAALYKWGPSRPAPAWNWVTPGAVAALIFTAIGTAAFGFYASNLTNFSATYGSLGGIIALLTWFWLVSNVLLTGAELNQEYERLGDRKRSTSEPTDQGVTASS